MGNLPYVIFFLLLAATVLAKAVSFFTMSKKHGFGATITWMALRSKAGQEKQEQQEEESESSSDFDEVEDWVGSYDPDFDYDYWLYEP